MSMASENPVTSPGAGESPTHHFSDWLGLQFVELTGEKVVATWQVQPRMHQVHGIVHGGIHCSVVETLGSVGAAAWIGEQARVVGVSNSTDFYRALSEGSLTSTATPVHQGRSQQVWSVETRAEGGKLVSRGQVRLQHLYAR